jgi:hypothetical protein
MSRFEENEIARIFLLSQNDKLISFEDVKVLNKIYSEVIKRAG